ncbi:Disease resistance protein (NBS-LRR class) family [Raphanus sativus]|uniref:Disease resistance RPP13-like protein 3 n=1 Tax=Raphanus sativus TaxID=3726 RepID=A0A6J0LA08_RAPSA|nr:putative disease resistance RPP13-like protein 3 [Raphanus sativus]KAJ4878288.1 Disease resistance protein (NBS-LRR class) family [Raphanus sativus]
MVDAIMGFVVGKMGNYLIEEASILMGIKDELEELKTELTCIRGYLKDVEARERDDEVSKEWTKLVLDIAYDVEDVLDSYNLKVEKRSQRQGLMRLTNKIGEKIDAYSIVSDIRTLRRRVLDVTRKRETYGVGNFSEHRTGESSSSLEKVRKLRRARSVDQEELVVGLEDEFKFLLAKLLDDDDDDDDGDQNRYMISIFGMGGLGKTALARKLYNSDKVKTRYAYRAWTSVSQEYKTGEMLLRIIRSLGVSSGEELEKIKILGEEELEVYLHGLLQGKRYLLVVDDIWEREAWESLKRALPSNHKGNRVIITTRIRDVAEGVDQRVYAHELRFLTFKESWELFEQRAFRNMQRVDEDLKRIGKQMVKKCRGLPLAIVVLAGLMSRKRPNEWNEVCASLWRRLKDDSIHVSTVFDLSFKELHHELKLCFLYLSVFPEDYEIEIEKLIHLLVAEGFVQEDGEMTMEDVAGYYLEELIDRSLVEAVRTERGRAKSCRVHDLLRDVALKKAKEVNFVHIYNDQQQSCTTCTREVVHHHIDPYTCVTRVNKRMRSFLFFGERNRTLWSSVKPITLKLELLRVLHLEGLQLRDVIGELIHLRYLGITDSFNRRLPDFISSLRFLQTLDASRNDSFRKLTDLRRLTSVRHIKGRFVGDLLIGDAVNLQTLTSISSYSWIKLKHELLINLRELEIYDSMWVNQTSVPLDLSSFSKLTKLRVLTLKVPTFKLSSETEEAVRFQTLVKLSLRCDIRKLPKDMDSIFPSLESLRLVGLQLEEDPMHALKKLQRLEDVILDSCHYSGEKMRIGEQGFGRLRKLVFYIEGLDELQIEDEAMPSLVELKLRTRGRQMKLMIPDRLRAVLDPPYIKSPPDCREILRICD